MPILIPEDVELLTVDWDPARNCMTVYGFPVGRPELTTGKVIGSFGLKELYQLGFRKDVEYIRDRIFEIQNKTTDLLSKMERYRCHTFFCSDSIKIMMVFPFDEYGTRFYQREVYEYKFEGELNAEG